MNTLTNKDKLALQVSLALVAGMFSLIPTAQGAPVLDKRVTEGTVIKNPSTGVTAIQSDSSGNNIINWKDFSIKNGEKVLFDSNDAGTAYTKTNNYLNVVTGAATSYINGDMKGGKNVYLVNPNGVIMGQGADIDVGNLYVSTQKLSNVEDLVGTDLSKSNSAAVLGTTAPKAEVVNMGKIQANSVHVEGTNIRFLNTDDVKYKAINDSDDIDAESDAFKALPTLSSTSNTDTTNPCGVTLNGTGYVHVGYARTAENVTSKYNSEDTVTGKSASDLDYSKDSGKVAIEDYMLVRSAAELTNIVNDLSGNYMLAKDIPLSASATYSPLGDDDEAFSGQFDGNFFSVKNINIPRTAYAQYGGLFGRTNGARIENVKVVDTNIYTRNSPNNNNKIHGAGGIAGYAEDTTFINVANVVSSEATNTQGRVLNDVGINTADPDSAVGGLVGWAVGSTSINSSYNEATVYSGSGLVGEMKSTVDELTNETKSPGINNSYNIGKIWNRRNTDENITYYGLYGGTAEVENINNSYNAGIYLDTNGNALQVNPGVGPNDGTNCYDSATSTSASYYEGIFATSDNGVNDTWRIYEGHSLPLLRSFLKANGNGTVSVSYGLGLYATADSGTSAINNAITDFDADNVVYNGYYVGAMDVTGDSSRDLSAADLGYDSASASKVKNAGESVSLFYSTDQNGYDIPEATIKIVERNLAPEAGNVHVTKVYDGDANAEEALKEALTMSTNAIDVADIYNNGGTVNGITYEAGTLIETGLVKVGSTADEVGLDVGDTDNPKVTATYDSGADVITDDTITVNFLDPGHMLVASTNEGHETDFSNYKFDTSGFTDGSISVTGDITPRPVKVGLYKSTGLTKYYDKDSTVIKKEDSWWDGSAITANVYQKTEDNTGLLGTDGVSFSYDNPYYADSDGNAVVNAGTGYDAVYKFALTGTKASNYEIQKLDGTALTSTDGKYTLTGKGDIEKRSLSADNFVFYKDSESNIIDNNADKYGSKVYDNSSEFTGANGVTFSLAGNSVLSTAEAQGNPTNGVGLIAGDMGDLAGDLVLNNALFTDATGENPLKTVAAQNITYYVGAEADSAWANYTLDGYDVSGGELLPLTRKGAITPRTINLAMNKLTGIDKTYDGDNIVEDSGGDLKFYGTAAGNNHAEGAVTYDSNSVYGLVVDDYGSTRNDNVAWDISAVYKTTSNGAAATTDAQDVYLVNETPAAKDIDYTVKLTGDNAINYKLVYGSNEADAADGVTMTNSAMGTIEQLEVTPTFATITKQYDGTTYVLPTAVTFSDGTKGTLTPAKADGTTTAQSQIGITLSGVLDADDGKVYVETDTTKNSSFNALFNSPNVNDANTVTYSGLKLASTTGSTKGNNYKIASTGSGTGSITALALTENNLKVRYDPISKVYDATDVLNNAESYVSDFGVSGVVGSGTSIPTRDTSATTAKYDSKNRGGTDDHNVTFSHKINADTGGNYTFATSTNLIANTDANGDPDGTYTFKDTTAGKITKRDVTATIVNDNLTKTYDAMAEYTDGNRNEIKGNTLLALSDGTTGNSIFGLDGTTNVSTAVYDTANADSGKTVTYTTAINTIDATNYNIVDATLTGDGTINKRDLTLTFNPLTKIYDNTSKLTDDNVGAIAISTYDDGLSGAVVTADGTKAYGNAHIGNLDNDYAYGKLDSSGGFAASKNVVDVNAVQYNGIDADVLGADAINNYNLYYEIGDADKAAIVDGTGYGKGMITKKSLQDSDIVTTFNTVTKVYDADGGVAYTHYALDGYDADEAKAASDFVSKLTIDGNEVLEDTTGTSGYTISSATYDSANAGSRTATFKFIIGSDWTDNLDFSQLSASLFNSSTNTLTQATSATNGNASITAKTVYAALSEQYMAPTKVYDGTTNATYGSTQSSTGTAISADTLRTYVDVSGLMGNDAATVSAAYASKNVADTDAVLGNTVKYTVDLGTAANNYKLYTKDADGNIVDADGNVTTDENSVLRGSGTIKTKEVTFLAGYTQKTYDNKSTVNGTTVSTAPSYAFDGLVSGETLTPDSDSITGNYVIADITSATGYTADANVEALTSGDTVTTVLYKGVQYEGLNDALANATSTNDAMASNYTLTGAALMNATTNDSNVVNAAGTAATYFDSDTGTAVYAADLANGKITRRVLTADDIEAKWTGTVIKAYDGTSTVENPTEFFSIHTKSTSTDGVEYELEYDLGSHKYFDANGNEVSNAGKNYHVQYVLNGLTGTTTKNFDISGLANGAYTGIYDSTDTTQTANTEAVYGTIKPRVITGTVTDGNVKIYDGNTDADGSYFTFSSEDETFMQNEGAISGSLSDFIDVTATYDNKAATISPEGISSEGDTENGRTVTYDLSYNAAATALANNGNYVLATDGSTDYEIDAVTYTGTGDIRKRIVYVKDTGGTVQEKVYDGSTALSGTVSTTKFTAVDADGDTGIVDSDVALTTVNGAYVDKNVAWDSGGHVINKAVNYSGFALTDSNDSGDDIDDRGNYYLMADSSVTAVTLTDSDSNTVNSAVTSTGGGDSLVITEAKGGKITPKSLTVDVAEEPTKEYDGTTAVVDPENEAGKYTTVNNIVVDGVQGTNGSLLVNDTNGTDIVAGDEVEVTLSGAPTYNKLHANRADTAVTYKLQLSNANYELAANGTNDNVTQTYSGGQPISVVTTVASITPRVLSGKTTGYAVKVYDGTPTAETDAFSIDDDDLAVLKKDNLVSAVQVTGIYDADDIGANISPTEDVNEDKAIKNVTYTLSWAGSDNSDYTFAVDNGTGDEYKGKGAIRQRIVYVQDNGGKTITKEYNRDAEADESVRVNENAFGFAAVDNANKTGVVNNDDVTLSTAGVSAKYVKASAAGVYAEDYNVERNSSGAVVNKAVQFTGFGIEGTDSGNYYLMAKDNGSDKVAYNGGSGDSRVIGITETAGGKITPVSLKVDVLEDPTKVYDGTTAVTGKYATMANLSVDGVKGSGKALALSNSNDARVVNGDTVNVSLAATPAYNDSHVVTADSAEYSLSLNNNNYELELADDSDDSLVANYSGGNRGAVVSTDAAITPRTLTVSATGTASKVYDGNTAVIDAAKNLSLGNLASADKKNVMEFIAKGYYYDETGTSQNGDAYTSATAAAPISHVVKYSGFAFADTDSNYASDYVFGNATATGTGTISRKELTVTAIPQTVKVKDVMPDFTGQVSGLVSGDSGLAGKFSYAPESGTTTEQVGEYAVYGWYMNRKEGPFDKNYTFTQDPENLTALTVESDNQDIGYIDKPAVPDRNVYQNVSKDMNDTGNRDANAAIQYGEDGEGIVADNGDSSSNGTIAIELVEVVNLLRGDVASDGTMSLTNTDKAKDLTVESTDSGYLSVGSTGNEGSIGIETKDDLSFEAVSSFEPGSGSDDYLTNLDQTAAGGMEGEVSGNDDTAVANKEGSIALETEGEVRTGEAEISNSDDRLVPLNGQTKDEEEKDDKKKNSSDEGEDKEGEAAITYGDVA